MFSLSVLFRFSHQFSFKPLYRYYPANIRLDEYILKTSWRRLSSKSADQIIVLVTRLQDVFKTSSKGLAKTSSKRLQDILQKCLPKTSSTPFQDVFKMTLRCIQNISGTYCKNGYLQRDLPRSHLWEIYGRLKNLQEPQKFLKF